MAVDVSRIPNNNKFDPVREAILDLQTQLEEEGQIAYDGTLTLSEGTAVTLTGGSTFTANQSSNTTITIGVDLSVTTNAASGGGSLSYLDGEFTYTPPDLTSFIELTDLSVTTATASGNGALSYDDTTGVFTFTPSESGAGLTLQQVTANGNTTNYGISTGNITVQPSGTGSGIVTIQANSVGDARLDLTAGTGGTGVIKTTNDVAITFEPNATEKVVIASDGNMNVYEKLAVGKTTAAATYPLEVDGSVLARSFKAQMEVGGTTYTGTVDQYYGSMQIRTDDGGTISLGGSGSGTVQNNVFIKDGDLDVNGDVTADNFIGDGSQLTNLPAGSLDLQDVTDNGATTSNTLRTGNLLVGVSTLENYIAFRGTVGDDQTLYTHTFIGEYKYGGTEQAELILFKGNDPAASTGPDRIRHIGSTHVFQTYTTGLSGDFATIASSTAPITRLTINNDGGIVATESLTAGSFIKSGGTSSQFLKADGSVDSNTYLTSYTETDTLGTVTARSASSGSTITLSNDTPFNFTGVGTGTYDIGAMYNNTSGMTFEAPLESDSGSAARRPLRLTWRGGYNAKGGLELTGDTKLYTNNDGFGVDTTSVGGTYGKLAVGGGIRINDDNNAKLEIGRHSSSNDGAYIKMGDNTTYLNITNPTDTADLFNLSGDGLNMYQYGQVTDALTAFHVQAKNVSTSDTYTGAAAIELIGSANNTGHGRHAWIGAEGAAGTTYRTKLKFKIRDSINYTWAGTYEAPTIMTLVGDGKVGIGTDSPSATLDVHAPSTTAPSLTMGATAGQIFKNEDLEFAFGLNNVSPYNGWIQTRFAGNNSRSLAINPLGGSVGIGTNSPGAKLDVIGVVRSYSNSGNYGQIQNGSFLAVGNHGGTFMLDLDNTGTADLVNIKKSGNTRFYIQNGGNVGIGTTNPSTLLDIQGSREGLYIERNNGAVNYGGHIRMRKSRGSLASRSIVANGDTLGSITFESYNGSAHTEQTGIRAVVNGTVSGSSIPTDLFFAAGSSGLTASNERMRIKSNGDVGIGTDSPSDKLHIYGAGNGKGLTIEATDNQIESAVLKLYPKSTDSNLRNWAISAYRDSADDLSFSSSNAKGGDPYGSGTTRMLIEGITGNVGIGKTDPSYKLDVAGSSRIIDTNSAYLRIETTNSSTYRGAIQCSYNYTEPFAISGYNGHKVLRQRTGSTYIDFYSGNNISATLNSSGLGISQTQPTEKLHVSGNIRQTGYQRSDNYQSQGDYAWHWHGVRYSTYYSDVRTKLYEYFYNNTAAPAAETYVDTYNINGNAYMGENVWGDVHQYHAMFKTYIYVKRTFTVTNAQLNGDDPHAIWIDGTYVAGRDSCCTATPYTFTFTVGWHKIELIYSEAGGGHYVQMGWNPKDYTAYISAMNPHGPVDLYNLGGFSYRDGKLGIGVKDPSYTIDASGTIRASGDVIAYSDARVKENVHTIDNALDKVTQLRGVSYNKIGETEEKIGVIAQEIEKVLPQVVQEDAEGMKSVAYGNIVGVLIESIKELKQEIDELKSQINGITN
jgi:hypothetical protein